ncbi:MAG: metallophosphoesterase [Oscillospiraceae bacterium]|jgi:3',5'-cyclic AMP phosphodiesterase CpdA|nr:metallophosphoesterase [Oscillospiraceae bacterium]
MKKLILSVVTALVLLPAFVITAPVTLPQNIAAGLKNAKTAEPFVASTFSTNQKVGNPKDAPLDLYVISDTHITADAAHVDGQIDFANTEAVAKAAFDKIIKDDSIQNVLLTGDLTTYGDRESCDRLVTLLETLEAAGKKVYPYPAGHDYDYNPTDTTLSRSEAMATYRAFAERTGNVIAESPFDDGNSYVVQIAEGYRMLMLTTDSLFYNGYKQEELDWVLRQIRDARESGNYIFSTQHYPVLLPSPLYPYFGSNDWKASSYEFTDPMVDAGLEFVFCGHSHVQSVVEHKTEKGNTLYQVTTAPLAGSPGLFRKVRFSYDSVKIESVDLTAEELKAVGIETGGKNSTEFMRENFAGLITGAVHYAATDMEKFAEVSGELGLGLSAEDLNNDEALRLLLNIAGKLLDRMKIKTLKNLLLIPGKIDEDFAERYVKDFAAELVTGVSYGNMNYKPGTEEYLFIATLIERVRPIINLIDDSGETITLVERIADGLLYKEGLDDWNLILPRLN